MTYIMNIMPSRSQADARPARSKDNVIAVLAYDGVNAFELGIAVELFGLTDMGPDWYRVIVCSERPKRAVAASGNLKIVADAGLPALRLASTVIVPGWESIDAPPPAALLEALRRAHKRGARIASICSGVFVLAAAGLLAGRRVTAHWATADVLAQRYPQLRVDPNVLYVDDGDILTSAGRAAGLDLCMHIVRRDYGAKVANQAARRMVIPTHREGGQAQFIPRPVQAEGAPLAALLAWARRHLDETLTVDELAAKAGMSKRTFIRRFEDATGTSPGEWILQERVARACSLLEETRMSIEQIATSVGFGTTDTLRHHFRGRLDTSPARYRAGFRA
jgi:AraC family transcriptional activator FtrA